MDDTPRTLKSSAECERRRQMLDAPHILLLTKYVKKLRKENIGYVPDFDPLDGGINAEILFLFEKPGPKTIEPIGSGFISRNNNDKTAENTFNLMKAAHIPRNLACIWNTVPAWNGTTKVTSEEVRLGIGYLEELLYCLNKLRVIVLVGNKAHRAQTLIRQISSAIVIHSLHPGPIVYAARKDEWDTIKYAWADARRCLGFCDCQYR